MITFLLINFTITLLCFYLLNWNVLFNNKNAKMKFIFAFFILASIPILNIFLFIYLLLERKN